MVLALPCWLFGHVWDRLGYLWVSEFEPPKRANVRQANGTWYLAKCCQRCGDLRLSIPVYY